MALIEFKGCSHCNKATWQEFVTQSSPAGSYWRCRECGERRDAMRISLSPGCWYTRGRVQIEDVCADVFILNISRTGARLRGYDCHPIQVHMGAHLLFNPKLQPFGELAHFHPGIVRWKKAPEFGICFEEPLPLPACDITRIVKN
jgi:hypothetical protein